MGRNKITRKAWQRATNVLLWYPDNKREYASLLEELTSRNPEKSGNGSRPAHPDPTAGMAIRMAENRRMHNLEQEIEAVELAVSSLRQEQIEVVRRRFWEPAKYGGGRRKPRQYDYLQDAGYSVDGMKKIIRQVILSVAGFLGEK